MSMIVPVLIAVAASGCGTPSSGPAALSKREYIERANALQRSHVAALRPPSGRAVATPALAAQQLASLDDLLTGYEQLRPPVVWRRDHERLVDALRTMRTSMAAIARAPATQAALIRTELRRYAAARQQFQLAVERMNATR